MSRCLRSVLCTFAALVVAFSCSGPVFAAEGDVRVFKFANSSFDRFTSDPGPALRGFIRERYSRMVAFSPYFDSRTSWYPNALAYQDLYAIYSDGRTDTADRHPEWILRDRRGRKLYIPFGCDNGSCPQYAGDVGDPRFRRWWIDRAKQAIADGYRGIFVDDANMDMRVGDGRGNAVRPIDERTGKPMTDRRWRAYVSAFLAQLRRELPKDAEIAMNALWYAGGEDRDRDKFVRRQLRAADTVVLEHALNDDGLQGGDGEWSARAWLRYVDRRHAQGTSIVVYDTGSTPAEHEYNLAGYLLVAGARDAFGRDEGGSDPDDWWRGLNVSLGRARGVRYDWNGLVRRDFEHGTVLLNTPDAPTRHVELPAGLHGLDGRPRSSITLPEKRGAVLMSPAAAAAAARR